MKRTVGPAVLKIDPALAERFRRVCPHWAEYILGLPSNTKTFPLNFNANGRGWYIVNSDTCIIGDAHGHNSAYRKDSSRHVCGACTMFSMELMDFNGHNVDDREPAWNETLKRFLNHFEEAHAK